ncbi:MAG TPA: 2OG-Fe dioxygenase family protein [Steroidobacteraceae bacterium]|nr:2OG-Fe dioxygenase family protein [Steroidobacteraceae bacterium]
MSRSPAALQNAREAVLSELRSSGYALLAPMAAAAALDLELGPLDALAGSWERLPRDAYLRDGGHYRARRHSCFLYTSGTGLLAPVAQRPHWQPTTYNALHGGMLRWFEPIEAEVAGAAAFRSRDLRCSSPSCNRSSVGTSKHISSASTRKAPSAGPHPKGQIAMASTSWPWGW